jgi:hypothetical protein
MAANTTPMNSNTGGGAAIVAATGDGTSTYHVSIYSDPPARQLETKIVVVSPVTGLLYYCGAYE